MPDNERKVRNLQKKHAKEDKSARDTGLSLLTKSPDGRRFIWLFLESCQAFNNPYAKNALEMAFNCGVQSAGQRLLTHITEFDPDAFLVMMKENQDVSRSRSTSFDKADGAEPDYYADDG